MKTIPADTVRKTDTITLIGDVHGKVNLLQDIHASLPEGQRSIQLGDMGFGFTPVPDFGEQHKFIRGNHDDPAAAKAHKNYLGDYGYLADDDLFYISSASSIDREWRVEGVSWWPDEELSMADLNSAIDLYTESRPEIVISHECPTVANMKLLAELQGPYFAAKGGLQSSRTCQAMQEMFNIFAPRLWIFGHYHVNKTFELRGTNFTCLSELSTMELSGK